MAKKKPEAVEVWYLRDWFATVGLKQHDLVKRLDYPLNTAFKLWHGVQPARADHIADIAALLHIEPWELLMHPEEAMRLRRMRATIAEAAGQPAPPVDLPDFRAAAAKKTGTDG